MGPAIAGVCPRAVTALMMRNTSLIRVTLLTRSPSSRRSPGLARMGMDAAVSSLARRWASLSFRPMIELWQLPLLFATGWVAGFVDSIAGGGGLIALPVLLSCGLEPRHALGTSKLQSTLGSGS